MSKMPTLIAMAYKYSIGNKFIYPKNGISYAANFMRMMFAIPCEEYVGNEVLTRAIDQIFILHADHEQNASTSTIRLCASSGTSPFCGYSRRCCLPVETSMEVQMRRHSICFIDCMKRGALRRSGSLLNRSRTSRAVRD